MKKILVLFVILLSVVVVEAQEDLRAHIEGLGYEPLPEKYRTTLKADSVCPIFVSEEEVWEAYYSVVTHLSAPWDSCVRYTFWSGWMQLEPGVYDIPEYEGAFWYLWIIQPIYSCEWLAGPEIGRYDLIGDCTRETHESLGFVTPLWYVVCPSWDAFPPSRFGSVCLFDDGFESGDASLWDQVVPPIIVPQIFSDGFEGGSTEAWSGVVP